MFLDGTWNERDDRTNVYHAYSLTCEGVVDDGAIQKIYYDEGVGTGVLDRVSGGAFGFGLEQKVRDAYNWLSEHYEPGDRDFEPDEIYIFGFSRGAYTARSLAGLISDFGLVRRGAPLTLRQLWRRYVRLGRQREGRTSWWESLFGKPLPSVEEEGDDDLTDNLLRRWTHRVHIEYLGLFDTVGAMGLDALAVPGLRGRLAMQHNMRATQIVRQCRHALAIEEHRSNFRHTPFLEYRHHGASRRTRKLSYEQSWFMGAHANVGGGYASNPLGAEPLAWILAGAQDKGLQLQDWDPSLEQTADQTRDSHSEFMRPLWSHVFRSKRFYRRIDPPDDMRASRSNGDQGFSLRTLDESVAPSAERILQDGETECPPNLYEFYRRPGRKREAPSKAPLHSWLPSGAGGIAWIVAWATLAGLGGSLLLSTLFPGGEFGLLSSAMLAAVWVLTDWAESRMNFRLAMRPDEPRAKSWRGVLLWLRMLGIGSFFAGLVALLQLTVEPKALQTVLATSAAAGVSTLLTLAVDRSLPRLTVRRTVIATTAPLVLVGLIYVAVMTFYQGGEFAYERLVAGPKRASAPAAALWIHASIFALSIGFGWVRGPLQNANLGGIEKLQLAWSHSRFSKQLEAWTKPMEQSWIPDEKRRFSKARRRVRGLVSHALWRDLLGFVWLYAGVLTLCLWLVSPVLESSPMSWLRETIGFGAPTWLVILLTVVILNVFETAVRIGMLRKFLDDSYSAVSVAVTCAAACLKFLGLVACLTAGVWGTVLITYDALHAPTSWPSWIAVLLSTSLVLLITAIRIAIRCRQAVERLRLSSR